ncbi:4Fe-4S ferredoxin [Clostridium fermenticellae]|uniref:4Fe-4S ferredoxin n=1 Tax=Clostridium fermenticellae TaxID=2068654 RepID=A0A386H5J3_9CLOT|nr:EFR1 family ferrodoxin [Clostridium fermenticellae]AYD40920.1 4Fe-4S ferredoxin [Clostridium fermenticellae]
MKIFYFTATGNSLAVAKKIGGELISIPQVMNDENLNYKDDIIGVIFPIYGCTVPKIVKRFLKKVKLEADYIFAIGTYGMTKGKTMETAQKLALESGYRFDYVNEVLMLDNCQPQFDIAEEKKKLQGKKVDESIAKIIKDVKQQKKVTAKSRFSDKAATWFCENVFNIEKDDYAKNYSVDDNCIKCGTCAKVCPTANIKITNNVEFLEHCACCQACIHACPQHAIHFKRERSTERWRNYDVKLSEIILANNQNSNNEVH